MDKKEKIELWINEIHELGERPHEVREIKSDPFMPSLFPFQSICDNSFFEFKRKEAVFYAYFQPALSTPAPLLVHTPGYGGEISLHPELATRYNVLHVNPLGYTGPDGMDNSKKRGGIFPVLPDTVLSGGRLGYKEWLADCVTAINWANAQESVLPDRMSFFGFSQGGGAALLLGSVYQGKGVRCVAASQPFLTDFKAADFRGAYSMAKVDKGLYEEAFTYIDTLNHVERLTVPVLLTAGGEDGVCPTECIENLYTRLKNNKSFTYFKDITHCYNRQFLSLATAWFELYA